MSEPVPNLPLLRKVLDHIDAHPDEWNQSAWGVQTQTSACGTAFCIAGHAAVMSGYEPDWDTTGPCDCGSCDPGATTMVGVREPGSEAIGSRWPAAVAAELLGLTRDEQSTLFRASNDRADVQRISEAIAARFGEVL